MRRLIRRTSTFKRLKAPPSSIHDTAALMQLPSPSKRCKSPQRPCRSSRMLTKPYPSCHPHDTVSFSPDVESDQQAPSAKLTHFICLSKQPHQHHTSPTLSTNSPTRGAGARKGVKVRVLSSAPSLADARSGASERSSVTRPSPFGRESILPHDSFGRLAASLMGFESPCAVSQSMPAEHVAQTLPLRGYLPISVPCQILAVRPSFSAGRPPRHGAAGLQ